MANAVKLFIVEGENRDLRFANRMLQFFMKGRYEVAVVSVPAAQNLYMLYEKLREDDFDTDIVEVLRESVPAARERLKGISRRDIDEVYLFFDFDPHQDNLVGDDVDAFKALEEMLRVFDNETDHGKLYVSYPMVEALYDYRIGQCQAFSGCFVSANDVKAYKRLVGDGNCASGTHLGIAEWKEVVSVFALRAKCLFDLDDLSFESYREAVTPMTVFRAERRLYRDRQRVFVLSAFPEFLLDYFKRSFWNSRVKMKRFRFDECCKRFHDLGSS